MMKRIARRLGLEIMVACPLLTGFSAVAEETAALQSGDFEYTLSDEGHAIITKYTGQADELSVPASLDGHPVVGIGERVFHFNVLLCNVSLPNGLQSIGDEAFSVCMRLTNISLPESLQSIGYRTFSDCYNLSSIRLPENLQNIGDDAFSHIADDAVFTVPRGSYAETWAEQAGVDYQYSD